MLLTIAVIVTLVTTCYILHLRVLEALARLVYNRAMPMRHPLPAVLFLLFALHLLEVVLYALGLAFLDWAGKGTLEGAVSGGGGWFVDHFYFSIASYTTLGIGDIIPKGDIRLVAGVEALNGLVLVSWSASFTYLVMERLWGSHGPRPADKP